MYKAKNKGMKRRAKCAIMPLEVPMQKRNYMREMEALAAGLAGRPRLLLHACCAPCSSSVLEQLHRLFRVTVYFDNPNLDTAAEFDRRAAEEARFVAETGFAEAVEIVPYAPDAFRAAARGLENEPEGGARCAACFRLRLGNAARYAKAHGFDFFTTTLTVSPMKNAALLNAIGEEAAAAHGAVFLNSDFKKKEGYKRSIELSKAHALYRQDYCGCVYSRLERERRRDGRGLEEKGM